MWECVPKISSGNEIQKNSRFFFRDGVGLEKGHLQHHYLFATFKNIFCIKRLFYHHYLKYKKTRTFKNITFSLNTFLVLRLW